MPYKFETEKFKVGKENDRRRKLTDEQKEEIRHKYATGLYSQRQLASEYKVSRRLIVFTIYPERLEQSRVNNSSSKYYDRDKNREYMRTHRAHKKQVYEKALAEKQRKEILW